MENEVLEILWIYKINIMYFIATTKEILAERLVRLFRDNI